MLKLFKKKGHLLRLEVRFILFLLSVPSTAPDIHESENPGAFRTSLYQGLPVRLLLPSNHKFHALFVPMVLTKYREAAF